MVVIDLLAFVFQGTIDHRLIYMIFQPTRQEMFLLKVKKLNSIEFHIL